MSPQYDSDKLIIRPGTRKGDTLLALLPSGLAAER